MDMNLQDILERAEILFYQFKQRMEAVDTKREQWQEILKTLDGEEKEKIKSDLNKLPNQDEALRDLL
ncbi:hypothetical protein G6F56_014032 [Rhizopus delemar]|nr:hypothetical protein G6F56_014032 [Rhizopus delemar]